MNSPTQNKVKFYVTYLKKIPVLGSSVQNATKKLIVALYGENKEEVSDTFSLLFQDCELLKIEEA